MPSPEPRSVPRRAITGFTPRSQTRRRLDVATISFLAVVPCVLSEATWLTPDQHVRLLAVASAVTGTVRLLADDPGTAITHGVARMCATLDHAARPDGPEWHCNSNMRSN
ncbi:hypothetical protein ACFW9S_38035 [Streptomyces anulatus]|uniref:hypothetical protein n=1 Tax=Streptomyces anulatus TaxID=1892 RepID=UPI0036AF80F1